MPRTTQPGVEQLLSLGGQVLEPVLPARDAFSRFRGLHLGAVCLNYMQGLPTLNVHGGDTAHFTDSYEYARGIARSQAAPHLRHLLQFTPEDAVHLSELAGEDLTETAFPAIVVALGHEQEAFLEPGDMEGEVFRGFLTVDDLDPYSQEVLAKILPGF
jgi:hypothetical protein